MSLRFANTSDASSLLRIYEQSIQTPITFEYDLPSREEFAQRIEEITAVYPYLVWEENGMICGYAYAHRFKERAAYQWGVELSVYIDNQYQSMGIGRRLYTALIALLKLQGVTMVYSGVTVPNEKSERLHLSMGFQFSSIFHNAGYKCGKWHDVQWFECLIGELTEQPQPIISVKDLPRSEIEGIMMKCST